MTIMTADGFTSDVFRCPDHDAPPGPGAAGRGAPGRLPKFAPVYCMSATLAWTLASFLLHLVVTKETSRLLKSLASELLFVYT